MSRDVVGPETAEANRRREGAYTFNAPIPADYDGPCFVVAAIRLGDHAHLDVFSGRHIPTRTDAFEGSRNIGRAGRLVLRWGEWMALRGLLDQHECVLIREVENPSLGNLDHHVGLARFGGAA